MRRCLVRARQRVRAGWSFAARRPSLEMASPGGVGAVPPGIVPEHGDPRALRQHLRPHGRHARKRIPVQPGQPAFPGAVRLRGRKGPLGLGPRDPAAPYPVPRPRLAAHEGLWLRDRGDADEPRAQRRGVRRRPCPDAPLDRRAGGGLRRLDPGPLSRGRLLGRDALFLCSHLPGQPPPHDGGLAPRLGDRRVAAGRPLARDGPRLPGIRSGCVLCPGDRDRARLAPPPWRRHRLGRPPDDPAGVLDLRPRPRFRPIPREQQQRDIPLRDTVLPPSRRPRGVVGAGDPGAGLRL